MPYQLRQFIGTMLVSLPDNSLGLWESFKRDLSEDFQRELGMDDRRSERHWKFSKPRAQRISIETVGDHSGNGHHVSGVLIQTSEGRFTVNNDTGEDDICLPRDMCVFPEIHTPSINGSDIAADQAEVEFPNFTLLRDDEGYDPCGDTEPAEGRRLRTKSRTHEEALKFRRGYFNL
ncbi:Helitron helicase [Phytophthora megakarya]|uniref:Helitron helicase n=1 Tax=Phytophthora megakarya TaxID=4795 RepID=A0A225UTG4_9STRA|nr:Helitron helicase [Phytophthora megakarya]